MRRRTLALLVLVSFSCALFSQDNQEDESGLGWDQIFTVGMLGLDLALLAGGLIPGGSLVTKGLGALTGSVSKMGEKQLLAVIAAKTTTHTYKSAADRLLKIQKMNEELIRLKEHGEYLGHMLAEAKERRLGHDLGKDVLAYARGVGSGDYRLVNASFTYSVSDFAPSLTRDVLLTVGGCTQGALQYNSFVRAQHEVAEVLEEKYPELKHDPESLPAEDQEMYLLARSKSRRILEDAFSVLHTKNQADSLQRWLDGHRSMQTGNQKSREEYAKKCHTMSVYRQDYDNGITKLSNDCDDLETTAIDIRQRVQERKSGVIVANVPAPPMLYGIFDPAFGSVLRKGLDAEAEHDKRATEYYHDPDAQASGPLFPKK